MAEATIKIRLKGSPIGAHRNHKKIVRALGLRKLNQIVEKPDTPGFRGMVTKAPHLLEIVGSAEAERKQ
jgi:large subunit ribosomal protein L30